MNVPAIFHNTIDESQSSSESASEDAVFNHKCLMLTINHTASKKGIYEATQCSWKLSRTRVKEVEYVLSVVQGTIVGVFKPLEWLDATRENFSDLNIVTPGRIGFKGLEAEESVKQQYLHKRVPARPAAQQNPVRYSFREYS